MQEQQIHSTLPIIILSIGMPSISMTKLWASNISSKTQPQTSAPTPHHLSTNLIGQTKYRVAFTMLFVLILRDRTFAVCSPPLTINVDKFMKEVFLHFRLLQVNLHKMFYDFCYIHASFSISYLDHFKLFGPFYVSFVWTT